MKLRTKLAAAGLATSAALLALRSIRGRNVIAGEREQSHTLTRTERLYVAIDAALEDAELYDEPEAA